MWIKKLKNLFFYIFILAAGLGSGYMLVNLPQWLKTPYIEGDYSSYFPSKETKIVLYGTSQCPYCAMARGYFQEKKIQFVDLDIEKSDKALREFNQLGGKSVPIIIIDIRRIDGFNESAIEAALFKLNHKNSL